MKIKTLRGNSRVSGVGGPAFGGRAGSAPRVETSLDRGRGHWSMVGGGGGRQNILERKDVRRECAQAGCSRLTQWAGGEGEGLSC